MTTTYVAPDTTGTGQHARIAVTAEQSQQFGDMIERIFNDGIARFGSVEGFTVALDRYNAERRLQRETL